MSSHTTTTTSASGTFTSGSDYAIAAIIAAAAFTTIGTWLTGQLSGLLFAFTWPDVPIGDALAIAMRLPQHWADPRQAWPEPGQTDLPGPVGFYLSAALVLATLSALIVLIVRWKTRSTPARGFATRAQLARALSAAAALGQARKLRPDLDRKPQVAQVAIALGRAQPSQLPLYAPIDNSVVVLAAPRQGKTSQIIIPWLTDWHGPAVVTSVRPDVIEATYTLRRDRGPVTVLDFTGQHWPDPLRWTPLAGCDRYDTARARAEVMVRVGKSEAADSTNTGFFGMTAVNLLAGWMHIAALTGRTMDHVLTWALSEGEDEPILLLAGTAGANPHVAATLEGIYNAPAETRSNMWATAMTALAPLVRDDARHTFTPSPRDSFDIEHFLRQCGTIYILVSEKDAADLAPLISAFVEEITTVAKRLADTRPSGRLSPPLGLFLDEVANVVPLPILPALMSYAGGSGIFAVAVFQSLAQARRRWGRDGADMLMAAATIKIALGGLTGDELADLSRLAGKYREKITSVQHGPHGATRSAQLADRDTISPEQIRTLNEKRHEALIVHATTPAVITRMRRHYEGPHAKAHAQAVDDARRLRTPGRPSW